MDELEKAHLDYEKRKNEIISKLQIIKDAAINEPTIKWLKEAINFIKEKEIWKNLHILR